MASSSQSVQDSPARRLMEPNIKQAITLLDDALNSPVKSTVRSTRNTPVNSSILRRKRESFADRSFTQSFGESQLKSSRLVDASLNYDPQDTVDYGNFDFSLSFAVGNEPWNNALDQLFVDFLQSMQIHKSEHKIFETVRGFIENCSNALQLVTDLELKVAGRVKLSEKIKWLTSERETWRLIYALYKDRLNNLDDVEQNGDKQQVVTAHAISEKEVVQEFYKNDRNIRECQLVVDWLEQNALQRAEDEFKVQHYTNKTVAWENTLHQLQNSLNISYSSTRPILSSLDPDAPLRECKSLHDLDTEDESKLIRGIFNEIRYGRLEEAQNLCFHCGQPWRAATLEGWRLYHDPNYGGEHNNSGEKLPVEGNPNRDVWKVMAWRLASNTRLPIYARASYAALCGHLETLENLCESWADLLWAYLKVMIDVRVEKEVRASVFRTYVPMPDEYWQNKLSLEEVFTKLAASKKPVVSMGAENPDHIVQTCIIGNDIPHLMSKMLEWLPQADAQFLRFMAHLVLFYRSCGYAETDAVGDSVLEAYVKVLMKKRDPQLVACYVATLPQEDQVQLYAKFLENVCEENERIECLTAAEDAGLDIEVITKRVVENIRNRESSEQFSDHQIEATPEDLVKVSALDWLIFYPSQRAEALFQANAMIRQFLAFGRMESARKAFSKIPVDSIDIILQEFQRGMSKEACEEFDMDCLPYRIVSSIREYFCHKAYLDAQEGFSDWFHHFHNAKPTAPAEPVGEVAFTEKVLFDHKKSQYNMELERWKLSMQQQTKMVKTQLHNVLLFPDGGWLVDIHSKEGPLEEELNEEGKCRLQQMENLRKICIPKVALLLVSMMHSMGDHAECIQLVEIIISEQHQIYKVYTPQKMRELLKKIAESSLELMKNKRDPWGHPLTF